MCGHVCVLVCFGVVALCVFLCFYVFVGFTAFFCLGACVANSYYFYISDKCSVCIWKPPFLLFGELWVGLVWVCLCVSVCVCGCAS